MRNTLYLMILAAQMFVLTVAKAQDRPNIIYIMADDLGYADLSCYGRKEYKTPHLDRLSEQGVKLLNAYSSAPVCTPTRVAFFTGRYPARVPVGLYEPITSANSDSLVGIPAELPTLPILLQRSGYETNLVGKWHVGDKPEFRPRSRGFDYFYGFTPGAIDYVNHRHRLMENDAVVEHEGYMTDLLEKKAEWVIKKKREKPFFLALMFNAPHWPWQGPKDPGYPDSVMWTSGGSPSTYVQMMQSLDDAVGKILQAIDDAGISKNTVVIFTSDNGGERFSDMGPFKGSKMQLWEGGIRVPAFVRWPDRIRAGSSTRQVATTMDWTATILSLAGAKPDPKFPVDGIDLMPILIGQQKEMPRELYWRVFQRLQNKAMREGSWKYLQDKNGEYLFNLDKDPYEKEDVRQANNEVFQRLKNKYAAWESSVLKPIPLAVISK
jgi:arylsulfatase A-like enzyme